MNEGARFLLCLAAAIGVHAAVLPGLPGSTGGGAGEGGANAVSVVAAGGEVEAMVARWQSPPDVGVVEPPDPAPDPALQTAFDAALTPLPRVAGQPSMALPTLQPLFGVAPDTPLAVSPPPERDFAALPLPVFPDPGPEPAILVTQPVLPATALVHRLALPDGPQMHPNDSTLPAVSSLPGRAFSALPPIPVPQVHQGHAPAPDTIPTPSTRVARALSGLAAAPLVDSPGETALAIGAPPPPPTADAGLLPPERSPIPPRRAQRALNRADLAPSAAAEPPAPVAPDAPTRTQSAETRQPAAQSSPSPSAPALAARGQGGGAQAGQGGGAVAAGDPGARRSAMARWGAQIHARIERRAQRQRGRGSVTLGLRVQSGGALEAVSVRRSSGDAALDQAAMAIARAAAPFAQAPDAVGGGSHAFSITLTFRR